MCDSTAALLSMIAPLVTIYLGFPMLFLGFVGNLLTLLVFLSLETFRQSSCAFYLTMASFINTFHLFTGLLTFIVINGIGDSWLNASLIYCKFRQYFTQVCIMTSMSCMCLATIDQFLATQSNVRWYRFNNVKLARYIFLGLLLCLVFLLVPYLIFYNHIISASTGKVVCAITNAIFSKYNDFAQSLFVLIIIPMFIMTVFGLLAYRNVQNISYRTIPLVRRELEKQLTSMVLVQVFYNVPVMTPMLIATFYNGVAGSTLNACDRIKMGITINLCILWYYLFAVGAFYIYISVSKRFRQQLIYVLFNMLWEQFRRRFKHNLVEPQKQ
ncbi:unnamed protein product [Adineta ricciae]|uniref:G-protein coupled receptors family 1 profile domain-containing protein n=1 Tax=Adineta ricciae TaxID=249248 RepID=A0A814UK82_ADIRI|nr:unnamed protein product [Adineta ricciae]